MTTLPNHREQSSGNEAAPIKRSFTKEKIRKNIKKIIQDSTATSLVLSNCRISDEEAVAIVEYLGVNINLTRLDLSYNQIGDKGAIELFPYLFRINQTLTSLDLSKNQIGDEGVKSIAAYLKTNRTLTSLNLFGNAISYVGAVEIIIGLETNYTLTTLNLDGNDGNVIYSWEIGDQNLKKINSLIERNCVYKEFSDAVKNGNEQEALRFININGSGKGVAINGKLNVKTAVEIAIKTKNLDALALLFKAGATINMGDYVNFFQEEVKKITKENEKLLSRNISEEKKGKRLEELKEEKLKIISKLYFSIAERKTEVTPLMLRNFTLKDDRFRMIFQPDQFFKTVDLQQPDNLQPISAESQISKNSSGIFNETKDQDNETKDQNIVVANEIPTLLTLAKKSALAVLLVEQFFGKGIMKEIKKIEKTNKPNFSKRIIEDISTATSLNLSGRQLSAEKVMAIAEALVKNKTLESLNLGDNRIGDAGAIAIAGALETNYTLTSLEFRNNDISDENLKRINSLLKRNYLIREWWLDKLEVVNSDKKSAEKTEITPNTNTNPNSVITNPSAENAKTNENERT